MVPWLCPVGSCCLLFSRILGWQPLGAILGDVLPQRCPCEIQPSVAQRSQVGSACLAGGCLLRGQSLGVCSHKWPWGKTMRVKDPASGGHTPATRSSHHPANGFKGTDPSRGLFRIRRWTAAKATCLGSAHGEQAAARPPLEDVVCG